MRENAFNSFGDYIIYVDESGDHNLNKPDEKFPVFVLAFCIFNKKHYNSKVVPLFQDLKFRYFGHDMVVLHEREINKKNGQFSDMSNEKKKSLIEDISLFMSNINFIVISCVIKKHELVGRYANPANPYHLAMQFSLERIYNFMLEKGEANKKTTIVFERRGGNEDKELIEEFNLVCNGKNFHRAKYNFEIVMASKYVNSTGMQIADLIARPIGNHALRPEQLNRSFNIIKQKFFCRYGREFVGNHFYGYGLKIFPT